ncbi:MAG: TIGR04290 family methyltransferase [Balneolales bacterium]
MFLADNSDITKQIKDLGPWFHNIHLPDGSQTAPDHFLGDFPGFIWDKMKSEIPKNLSGKTVLDIGCNAGYYSLKLAERGAQVTAIDFDTNYLKQAQWVINQHELTGDITLKHQQVYDLVRDEKQYDIVLFLGVFYHLRYPLLALDIISKRTKGILVFQTLSMPGGEAVDTNDDYKIHDRKQMLESGWPKMAFIEKKFNQDPTNWWFANKSCIEAMLRTCGFKTISKPGDELFIFEPDANNPGVNELWNESEYLSATNQDWHNTYLKKIR